MKLGSNNSKKQCLKLFTYSVFSKGDDKLRNVTVHVKTKFFLQETRVEIRLFTQK